MNLPIFASTILTIFFGAVAVYLSYKESQTRKLLKEQETRLTKQLYEAQVVKQLHEKTDYSIDAERIVEVLMENVDKLLPYATISALLVTETKLTIKTYARESVSHSFVTTIKQSMLSSLKEMVQHALPTTIEETISGVELKDENPSTPKSFFHIPLIIADKVHAILTITATEQHRFREEEITILYQITQQAAHAVTRLKDLLENEKAKLSGVIGSLSDGVIMVDNNSMVTLVNDSARGMLQMSHPRPAIADLATYLPTDFGLAQKIHQALTTNKTVMDKEVTLGNHVVQIFISPVHIPLPSQITLSHPLGNVIGVSILLHDITIEKSLARIKEDFTNMVVHELRAPLTAIKDAAKLMVTHTDPLTKQANEKLLNIIHEQAIKLLDQVGVLLDAAKLESGKFTIQKIPTDLHKLITDRIEFFMPQAQNHHIALQSDIVDDWPLITLDAERIGQVINNLILNSLKFTPEGGSIMIRASSDNNYIRIAISDTGIGISKADQAKLFSKYSQGNASVYVNGYQFSGNQTVKGTGLGLFIVKGIVDAHGGSITVDSDIGRGTTISFTIPMQEVTSREAGSGHGEARSFAPQDSARQTTEPTHTPPSQLYRTVVN